MNHHPPLQRVQHIDIFTGRSAVEQHRLLDIEVIKLNSHGNGEELEPRKEQRLSIVINLLDQGTAASSVFN